MVTRADASSRPLWLCSGLAREVGNRNYLKYGEKLGPLNVQLLFGQFDKRPSDDVPRHIRFPLDPAPLTLLERSVLDADSIDSGAAFLDNRGPREQDA